MFNEKSAYQVAIDRMRENDSLLTKAAVAWYNLKWWKKTLIALTIVATSYCIGFLISAAIFTSLAATLISGFCAFVFSSLGKDIVNREAESEMVDELESQLKGQVKELRKNQELQEKRIAELLLANTEKIAEAKQVASQRKSERAETV